MGPFNYKKAERVCRIASDFIAEIEPFVFSWISLKTKLEKQWDWYIEAREDMVKNMPPGWVGMMKAQCAFAYVFCDPQVLRKFRNFVHTELTAVAIAFCKIMEKCPWRFAFFTVTERLGNDFYRIVNYLSKEEGILKSPAVTDFLRESKKLFFTLLFDNGECLQTYGTVAYLNRVNANELEYYIKQVEGGKAASGDVSSCIARQPLPYLFLYTFAEPPIIMHEKEEIRFCASEVAVENPLRCTLPEKYIVNRNDRVILYRFGNESRYKSGYLYLDLDRKVAVLIDETRKGYSEAVDRIRPYLELPEHPQIDLGLTILLAIEKLTDGDLPYSEYIDLFSKEPTKEESKLEKALNRTLNEILKRYNMGLPINMKTIVQKNGLSEDNIPELERFLDTIKQQFSIDLPFGIEGYVSPPPYIRMRMAGSFEHNELFETRKTPKAELLFQRNRAERAIFLKEYNENEDLSLDELPDVVDSMYEQFWHRDDRIILTSTIKILYDQNDQYHEAKEYACEVLRMFHEGVLPESSEEAIHYFIRTYSRFLYLVLKPLGLIETDKPYEHKDIRSGNYKLRATEFFREWIRFKQEKEDGAGKTEQSTY